jgi:hypothetical protein
VQRTTTLTHVFSCLWCSQWASWRLQPCALPPPHSPMVIGMQCLLWDEALSWRNGQTVPPQIVNMQPVTRQ